MPITPSSSSRPARRVANRVAVTELLQHVLELGRRALERRMLVRSAYDRQRLRVGAIDEKRKAQLLLSVEAAKTYADRNRDLLLTCQFHSSPPCLDRHRVRNRTPLQL